MGELQNNPAPVRMGCRTGGLDEFRWRRVENEERAEWKGAWSHVKVDVGGRVGVVLTERFLNEGGVLDADEDEGMSKESRDVERMGGRNAIRWCAVAEARGGAAETTSLIAGVPSSWLASAPSSSWCNASALGSRRG